MLKQHIQQGHCEADDAHGVVTSELDHFAGFPASPGQNRHSHIADFMSEIVRRDASKLMLWKLAQSGWHFQVLGLTFISTQSFIFVEGLYRQTVGLSQSRSFVLCRMLVNNFLLDWTASSSAMYFSVSFRWIYENVKEHTRQYWRRPREAETSRWERVLLPTLIEKYGSTSYLRIAQVLKWPL